MMTNRREVMKGAGAVVAAAVSGGATFVAVASEDDLDSTLWQYAGSFNNDNPCWTMAVSIQVASPNECGQIEQRVLTVPMNWNRFSIFIENGNVYVREEK